MTSDSYLGRTFRIRQVEIMQISCSTSYLDWIYTYIVHFLYIAKNKKMENIAREKLRFPRLTGRSAI